MIKLVLLVGLLLICGWAAMQVHRFLNRRRMEQALRDNPPERARLEVRLPAEVTTSNQSMTRFFERLERILPNDDEAVQKNTNVVTFTFLGVGREVGQTPLVIYMLECPPELLDRIEVTLTECYGPDIQIVQIKDEDNPFLGYAEAFQSRQAWEAEQQEKVADQRPDADEDGEDR